MAEAPISASLSDPPPARSRSVWRRLRRLLARYRGWLVPAMLFFMVIKPPVMVLLQGRDLAMFSIDMMRGTDYGSYISSIGRIGTAATLGFAALGFFAWITGAGRYRRRPARKRAIRLKIAYLLGAALLFHFGMVVLPGLTGDGAALGTQNFYALIVILALWFGRKLPSGPVANTMHWALALLMIVGLALTFYRPEMTLSTAGTEQRLSFAENRFWGLGSGPNSIAPLALLQLILQIHQPMRRTPLWLIANVIAAAAAITVIVWAQSQTTWAAALVVIPLLLIRRTLPRRITSLRLPATKMVVLLIALLVGAGLIGGELIKSGTVSSIQDAMPLEKSGVLDHGAVSAATTIGDELLTGRGRIWAVAIDVWRDNPWLGYGLNTWSVEFRRFFGIPSGVHAHNQFLQAMAVGGIVGLLTLLVYLAALTWFSWRTSGLSRGLTIGLFSVVMIRGITEVPLDMSILDTADNLTHFVLLALLFSYGNRWHGRRKVSWASGENRVFRRKRKSHKRSDAQIDPGHAGALPTAGSPIHPGPFVGGRPVSIVPGGSIATSRATAQNPGSE